MKTPKEEERAKLAALSAMALNYDKDLNPQLAKLWLKILEPYSADVVSAAVMYVVQTYAYKTLPPFAVLQEAIRKVTGEKPKPEPAKALETRAEAEWGIVLRAMSDVGSYGSPDFCPQTERTVELMGGWPHLCATVTQSNMDFKRRDFIKLWQDAEDISEAMGLTAGAETKAIGTGDRPAQYSVPKGFLHRIDSIEEGNPWQLQ